MTKYNGYSINVVREHNLKIITRLLYANPLSCKELASITDLSETAIKKNISQLLDEGIVIGYKEETKKKSVGRQHIRYQINPHYGAFIGVDLTYNADIFYICDACGNIIYQEKMEFDVQIVKENFDEICGKIINKCQELNYKPLEIAVSIPGQIDGKTGIVNFSSRIKGEENTHIQDLFSLYFPNTYIVIQNDIRFALNGDEMLNERSQDTMALYVQIGYGIVCAIVHNGKILSGYKGIAGEIGTKIDENKESVHEKCTVSSHMLKSKAYANYNNSKEYFEAYKTNKDIQALVKKSARDLAHEIDSITQSVGCNNIVLLGSITNYGDMYLNEIKNTLNSFESYYQRDVSFLLGDDLIIKGMMKLLKEHICYSLIK